MVWTNGKELETDIRSSNYEDFLGSGNDYICNYIQIICKINI